MKILSKISSLVAPSRNVTAKVRSFSELPNFFGSFFFFLPGPSPWRTVRVTFPLESGCKSSAVKHNFQTFLQLFFKNFLGKIDNRVLISNVSHKLFSGYFRTSRAIPGEIPERAYGNFLSPLRKGLQSFPESTPVLPEKNWSTPRRALETDQEGKRLSIEDILHPSEKISSFAREDILLPPLKIYLALCPAPSGLAKITMAMIS